MTTIERLEVLELSKWVNESTYGYPFVLSLHAIGLAVVMGTLLMIDFRVLGGFDGMSFRAMRSVLKLAWGGFLINVLSGIALFMAQATKFVGSAPFLIKIAAIFVAALVTAMLQNRLTESADVWDGAAAVPRAVKVLAAISIALWGIALCAGRLIAYL